MGLRRCLSAWIGVSHLENRLVCHSSFVMVVLLARLNELRVLFNLPGGHNGYGAKLTNILSTELVIETADGKRQKKYKNQEKLISSVLHKAKEKLIYMIFTSGLERIQVRCNVQLNKQISQDKPIRKMNMPKDSCPSETSSSYNKKAVKQLNEAHSIEKKRKSNYRRESLASSSSEFSMGSPSYGSLTVYEKIPSKQGQWNEKTTMITPVRRSSRTRKLATSPS
ncbi:hypothetical protein RJT34_16041 [Clitoria ternatea]|uniref:Uncharacterized protein n=1 Tax=Clitoria ternatea TaxID=43366 RepID=A0AAN9PDB8_CLITE